MEELKYYLSNRQHLSDYAVNYLGLPASALGPSRDILLSCDLEMNVEASTYQQSWRSKIMVFNRKSIKNMSILFNFTGVLGRTIQNK